MSEDQEIGLLNSTKNDRAGELQAAIAKSRFAEIASKLTDEDDFLETVLLPLGEAKGTECVYEKLGSVRSPEFDVLLERIVKKVISTTSVEILMAGSNCQIAYELLNHARLAISMETRAEIVKHNKETVWFKFGERDIRVLTALPLNQPRGWPGVSPNAVYVF